jgi:Xaa-Pro dipeptidase
MACVGGSNAERQLAGLAPWSAKATPIAAAEYEARIEAARARLGEADALIVGAGPSLRYFTGLPWPMTERLVAMVLPRKGAPVMICPHFERGSLEAGLGHPIDIRLWQEDENPFALAAEAVREAGGTLAIDPALPFFVFNGIRKVDLSLVLVDGAHVIDVGRQVKSAAELALMSQAKAMTLEVHRRAAAILAPGMRASEVRRFIDQAHRALGADNGSTFCAVQFGRATAFPHGLPGDQALEENDIVLIDTGCQVQGYHSDITRTYAFGRPDPDHIRVFEVEKAAQAAAFAAVRPGVACEAVDAAAREVLEAHGYGPGYGLPGLPHRTGHGIGLSIHEPAYLVKGDRTLLQPGMCFSNEPMIVVPDRFGVRLEDHFHVTEEGAAWFTEPQHSLEAPFG